jgi:hypothetical protein
MEAAGEFKSTSGVSQEAALASLRDRKGVEESRNFERAGYDHVATVAISGVTGRRVWHPSISQQISSPSLWRQQVSTLTSPTQRNHLIAEGRYHTGRRRAQAQEFCSETGFDALVSRNTQFRVQRDNSMPSAVSADFAPLGGAWCCSGLRLWLEGG